MNETLVRDDKALEMRSGGRSYIAIAKALGFDRAKDAVVACNRALRRKPDAEQADLRQRELARLDGLAEGIRAREDLAPEGVASRLKTVEKLRAVFSGD